MTDRVFLDTNILVYLFDADAPDKQQRVREILATSAERADVAISTQVLKEFYVVVTRKLAVPLDPESATRALHNLALLPTVREDTPLILNAVALHRRYQISFWDALIVQAALDAGCQRLFTEDLTDGQVFESVRIENPFVTTPP